MAELAIASASVLVTVLVPFLTKYRGKDLDLIKDIESMESWLDKLKTYIELNDSHGTSKSFKDQMNQFRDIAYDIEDVLDEFFRHSPHVFRNHRITQQAHKVAHNLKYRFPLKNMRGKIENIMKRLKEIKLQNKTLGSSSLRPESSSNTRTRHREIPLLLEDELVGYEKERKEFNRDLIGEKGLVTIAVAGPVGSGKTTFVKTVFREDSIRGGFDCYAWVHVSRHIDTETILVNLLKQLCDSRKEPSPAADESLSIHEKIRKYIGKKSYIVVLDDIWREEDWNDIKDAFPNAYCGSRIIVTTRDSKIASICASFKSRYMYNLKGLESLASWRLFCSKAFQESNRECPVELKDCSVKIVKRCEGIPLAIVAVGSALAQKQKNPLDWEKFHLNLGRELERNSHLSVISNTLLQSYMDLSSSLKSCFLYFSIFPEDVSVEHGRLIRLWVAERFAIDTHDETAEEVAADYLNELIHRNLVHVSKWNFDGRPGNCRVLNLVHKFIIQKCKDENFVSIFTEQNTSASNKIRRLSYQGGTASSQHVDWSGVRSLLFFRCTDGSPDFIWNNTKRIELSRVIDFKGAPILVFPHQITDLTLLTYICFRDTKIKTIPKSIKKLLHLQTLDLKETDVTELPKGISKLRNLRHLLAYKYTVEVYVDFDSERAVKEFAGIGNLTELQKLSLVRIGQKAGILKELPKLSKLRKLGLTGIKKEHCSDLCRSIENMRHLSTLDLCTNTMDDYLHLEEISSPPDNLQRLYLKGRMKCIPGWINKLSNLVKIRLRWSKLDESPLKELQWLPKLLEIEMIDCYVGGELVFSRSSFKKLKVLIIQDFSRLHTIVIEEGSTPDLNEMSLRRCPNLSITPLGIQYLSKIKELVLYDMTEEFVDRIRMGRDDRGMVEHIPIIHYFITCKRSLENLSNSFYHREHDSQYPSTSL